MSNIISKIILRKGNTTDRSSIILEDGEPGWDNQSNELFVGNGVVSGGVPVQHDVDSNSFLIFDTGDDAAKKIIRYASTTRPNNIIATGNISTQNTVACSTLEVGTISPTGSFIDFGTTNLSSTDMTIVSSLKVGQGITDNTIKFNVYTASQFSKNTNFLESVYVTSSLNSKSLATDIITDRGTTGIVLSSDNSTNPALSINNTTGDGVKITSTVSNKKTLNVVHEATTPSDSVLCLNAPNAVSGSNFNFIECYNSDYSASPVFNVNNNGIVIGTNTTDSGITLNDYYNSAVACNSIDVKYMNLNSSTNQLSSKNAIRVRDDSNVEVFTVSPQGTMKIENRSTTAGTGTAKIELNSTSDDESYISHHVGGAVANERYIRSGAFVDAGNNSTFEVQILSGSGTGGELAYNIQVDSTGGNLKPGATDIQNLGSTTERWGTLYCSAADITAGASGTIDTTSSQTITVVNGIITNIA